MKADIQASPFDGRFWPNWTVDREAFTVVKAKAIVICDTAITCPSRAWGSA